ncbi:MAG TPA: methyltransferase domain-containing protein [Acidimicrobiales bacterium]|nr:methyltransferase domain-containing protein [Acidimicrobiales bacterium]
MDAASPRLVPKLDVSDLVASLRFYVGLVGFRVLFERTDERFAFLDLEGAHLMLQEAAGPGRRFRTAELERPYGRGINLQIQAGDVDLLDRRMRAAGVEVVVPLEDRSYVAGDEVIRLRQFVVADPDGCLQRLREPLGRHLRSRHVQPDPVGGGIMKDEVAPRVDFPRLASRQTMTRPKHDPTGWRTYLRAFHEERPGITEEILAASTSAGQNSYGWLLELIPQDANLLDLACGSAPLLRAGWRGRWVGADRSPAELDRAIANGGLSVIVADALGLPFDDHSFAAVACSMALMLLEPLDDCLAEVARVLVPGGTVALLLPGGPIPLTGGDLRRWGRLFVALRRTRFEYPNDRAVRQLDETMRRHGLEILTDDRRRFAYPVASRDAASRFVDSLYLPGVPTARAHAARRVANSWVGSEIGIPLRRVLLRAAG